MAEEVEMTPVDGAEPPKASPLPGVPGAPTAPKVSTLKLNPVVRAPVAGGATGLKPGLKLPPKPGSTVAALRPGLKLPPKPGATVSALRPGLKLPTQTALKPGVKLPTKPVIRKPGEAVSTASLPKPMGAVATPAPSAAAPTPAVAPISVDAQGIGKLPTVSATAVARDAAAPDVSAIPKPMEALKSVTQKLKGLTQEIPQQAILHKTGIISEGAVSSAQKEAAKHKTARISLADAMGVAPVKDEAAPMKTIRIRRPVDIPTAASATEASQPVAAAPAEPQAPVSEAAPASAAPAATVPHRKTLKVARPGTASSVRPSGKFGVKRPGSQAATVVKPTPAAVAAGGDDSVADIPEIPSMPAAPVPMAAPAADGSSWVFTLSALVQLAACGVIGALAWFLYQNTQTAYF